MVDEHKRFSNTGIPHLLVDMISANNAQYCDKESTSGGHFLYRAFLKMAAGQRLLQFHKKATKKIISSPNFKRDLKCRKSARIFRISTVLYIAIHNECMHEQERCMFG